MSGFLYFGSCRCLFVQTRNSALMSSELDKALMDLSLGDDDVPFNMPDLPDFCSSEKNVLSLMGRVLNPDSQPIEHLIRNMPRKW